ncbi:MAG: VanZ family protein [Nitrospinota bacterium]
MRLTWLTVSLGYMVVLFIISSFPDTAGSENILSSFPSVFQNMLHIPAFSVLTFLWFRVLKEYHYRDRNALSSAAGLAVLYGAGLELYQASVPGRFPSVIDLVLNLVGVVLFVSIYYIFKPHQMIFIKW